MVLDAGVGRVRLVADPTGLSASIGAGVGSAVKGAQGALAAAGAQMAKLITSPLALVAGAGAIVKLGLDFETAFAKISSVSNASTEDIAEWRGEVLSLAGTTAQAPKELADALFFLASAGLKAGQPMEVLEASAKASAVGLGETADIARLTANVLNAYADSGITAAQVTDQLVAAVRSGTAEADEFTIAIGRILPIAARAGVGFDQIVGSLAALSNIGLDVNEGVTALRGLLQSIVAPTTQSQKALKELSITTVELRDTLSEEGLPGALNLLEEASGGNIDVLRELIPNIRALTGELGLTGENADQVALIMFATANATGSLNKAFAETAQGPAFQFRQALEQLRAAGTELGIQVLPAITGALKVIAPLIAAVAKGAVALLAAFVAFKVVTALPGLLLGVAVAMESLGAVSVAGGILKAAVAMEALAASAAIAAAGIGLLALAIANSQFGAALNEAIAPAMQGIADVSQAAELAARTGMSFEEAFSLIEEAASNAAKAVDPLAPILDNMTTHLDKTGKAVRNFAGLTNKELKGFRTETIKNFSDVAGSISDTGAVFTLTANEVIRGITRMAAAQQRMAKDLQKLDALPIGDKLKARLISLGPEAVDGFVRGTAQQRSTMRAGLKVMDEAAVDTVKAVKDVIARGAPAAGAALPAGAIVGINSGSGALVARAHQLGLDTVRALNDALGNASPSKEGEKAGRFLVEGLVRGMSQRLSKVSDVLRDLVPLMQKALGVGAADQARAFVRDLDVLDRRFTKLTDKIRGFRDAIKQAFSGFNLADTLGSALEEFEQAQAQFLADQAAFEQSDRSGAFPTEPIAPDLSALMAQQVADAKELGRVLRQLQDAGLSTANLQQVAQGPNAVLTGQALLENPELIREMNKAQQQIADVLQHTGDVMVKQNFGGKVDRLGNQFDKMIDHIRDFIGNLQLPALKEETRDFINQIARMNAALEGSGSGGGGGNGNGAANLNRAGDTVVVNVQGSVVTKEQLIDDIHAGLQKKRRRNSGLGI